MTGFDHLGPEGYATESLAQAILDAMPLPVFAVDDDVQILAFNESAARMLAKDSSLVFHKRGGEVLHCLRATDVPEGCGRGPHCKDCVLRNSVQAASSGNKVVRRRARMDLLQDGRTREMQLLITAAPFLFGGRSLVLLTLEDVSDLMTLRGLLPICARCKKIRDDEQYWHSLETYLTANLNVSFTHGLCPGCAHELFPDIPQRS